MKGSKKEGSSSKRIADKRFASFETDPRYRLPSRKNTKTTIDKRFSRMLKDENFTATAKIDRYGRKLESDSKKKALQRLYQEEDEDNEEGDEIEVEDDEVVRKELQKAQQSYDPARGGGFSSSEDEESSEEEESDEEDGGAEVTTEGDMQRLQDEKAEVEPGEVTKRIAIVNLDWDHVRSPDLMALFSSFIPSEDRGRIEQISIYPSEFGKERMQQEELEGPPKELFKNDGTDESDDSESDEDSEEDEDERIKKELLKEGNDQDFDSDALRKYQLDRLRYYYAVMTCSTPGIAKIIYDATDGTEYQSSSNFLDLRFVPDEVTFDDEPRDSCDQIPDSYKPIEFVTNALQSSKVKLTWDMHPEETSRKEAQKRAFTGSRGDIEENDLKAYLASESEDSEEEFEEKVDVAEEATEEPAPKLSKKELARQKMREALGLGDETGSKSTKNGPIGGMQITFTPALSEKSKSKKAEGEEETTMEKYIRKEKERKEQKRQKARAKREGVDSDEDQAELELDGDVAEDAEEDLGFDDPFFTTEDPVAPSKTSIRKEERLKKREAKEAAEATSATEKAHLKKIMAADKRSNQAEHLDHFDMNEIIKAEKAKKKKGKFAKKGSEKADRGGLQQDFKMDVEDERFKAVFDSHEHAIDPTNPRFKGTEGMNKLLEEGRRKRRGGNENGGRDKKKRK